MYFLFGFGGGMISPHRKYRIFSSKAALKDLLITLILYKMGNAPSIKKVNFEDIQNILLCSEQKYLLINTLANTPEAQSCILPKTLSYAQEEKVINNLLTKSNDVYIIIYGRNSNDVSIYKKYTQLVELGLKMCIFTQEACSNGYCYRTYIVMNILRPHLKNWIS